MANLSIRNLDDVVADLLRKRAADRGVSMEEEVRTILRHAVTSPRSIAELATQHFGPQNGVDLEILPHPGTDPPDFAATASVHDFRLATRNTKDFDGLGLTLIDPFSFSP